MFKKLSVMILGLCLAVSFTVIAQAQGTIQMPPTQGAGHGQGKWEGKREVERLQRELKALRERKEQLKKELQEVNAKMKIIHGKLERLHEARREHNEKRNEHYQR